MAEKTDESQIEKTKTEKKSLARHDDKNITFNDLSMSRKMRKSDHRGLREEPKEENLLARDSGDFVFMLGEMALQVICPTSRNRKALSEGYRNCGCQEPFVGP